MIGESNQNVYLIQIDASSIAEFEISEFDISIFDCTCTCFTVRWIWTLPHAPVASNDSDTTIIVSENTTIGTVSLFIINRLLYAVWSSANSRLVGKDRKIPDMNGKYRMPTVSKWKALQCFPEGIRCFPAFA